MTGAQGLLYTREMSILSIAALCGQQFTLCGIILALGKLGDLQYVNQGGPHGGKLAVPECPTPMCERSRVVSAD
jgi:hypothetical protein